MLLREQSQEHIWAEAVQEAQEGICSEVKPLISLVQDPQRAQVWSDQQGQSEGSGARQVTQVMPWSFAECSGPAELHHRGQGRWHSSAQGCSGAGCGTDSGQCRRAGATVSCPWPAASPASHPQKSLHFRVAENRHPPFRKVTLRQPRQI